MEKRGGRGEEGREENERDRKRKLGEGMGEVVTEREEREK